MRKTVTLTVMLGLAVLLAGRPSPAEDKKKGAPDEKAQIEAMIKAATPGPQHKALEALAGSWDVKLTMWMDPSKPPTESTATAETKMILGGRYLEEKVKGEFAGMEFLGQSVTGYDNLRKKFTSTWIDNFGTGISASSGTYDADKKTFTYKGEEVEPLDGNKVQTKSVVHVIDKDNYEVDMFRVVGDKEVKVMHLDCKRKAK
jgi:hypothetical protein